MRLVNYLCILVGLCLVVPHACGVITETSYSIRTIHITDQDYFQTIVFTFTFDEDIKFINTSATDKHLYSPSDFPQVSSNDSSLASPICYPPLPCTNLPALSAHLSGLIKLSCPSEDVYSEPQYLSDIDGYSPPSYITIFTGQQDETLLNYFSQLGCINGFTTPVDNKKLFAILLLSYTEKGTAYSSNGRLRTIDKELQNKQCSLTFLNNYATFSLADNAGNVLGGTTNNLIQKSSSCVYYKQLVLSNVITATIANMSNAPDWLTLQKSQFKNALLRNSDAITACEAVVDKYISYKSASVTYPNTTQCLRSLSDPLYAVDPCCNTTLQFYQCCAPNNKMVNIQKLDSVNTKLVQCKNNDQSSSLLADYVINQNIALNPVDGCSATASKVANTALAAQYTDFIETCLFRIYGRELVYGYPCTNDSDCYTYCDQLSATCYVDYQNPDVAMLDCHMDLIDPTVVRSLKNYWQLHSNITAAEFRQEYYKRLSSENCKGVRASLYTWTTDAKGERHWVTTNHDECLSENYCSYNYGLDENECTETGHVCTYQSGGVNYPLSYPSYCYARAQSSTECNNLGGYWDNTLQPWECMLLDLTKDECLPDEICPAQNPDDFFTHDQCYNSFCYSLNIAEVDCVGTTGNNIKLQWEANVVSGSGYCQLSIFNESGCSQANGTWWQGRGWSDGYFLTEEQCTAGTCIVGSILLLNDPSTCKSLESCNRPCHACASTMALDLCYSNQTSTDCESEGGGYDSLRGICIYNYGPNTCADNGFNFKSCHDLGKTQCDACAAGGPGCPEHYDVMSCEFAWQAICQDERECESIGGRCSDSFFNSNPNCSYADTFLANPDCAGSCLHPLTPFPNGKMGCFGANDFYTTLGCLDYSIYSKAECLSMGAEYWWQLSPESKQECEAAKGCAQNGATDINLQNPAECSKCHGNYQSIYNWREADWLTGEPYPLKFVEAGWKPLHTWGMTLDFQKVVDSINRVVAETFAPALRTESMCLYNPLLEVLSHIACDCTQDSTAPPVCYSDGTRVISVGVQRFYSGIVDSVKAGAVQLEVYENTLPLSIAYLDTKIEIASATQFKKSQTLSTDVLTSNTNPYAIIKNSHKAVVGQLVGDGAVLTFEPASFSKLRRANGFMLRSGMKLCVQARGDISQTKKDFPVADFATCNADYTNWVPLNANVTITSDGYCFTILEDGIYFPILRTANWATQKNPPFIADSTVRAFIYLFGVIFILLAFFSAYCLWIAMNNPNGWVNMGTIIFFFMILFNLVRGLYMLILPSGELENNIGGKYFLSEAPQFIFFSVYSGIIFLWAELGVKVVSHKSFLHYFKWPFVGTNISLYLLFIILISIFHNVSDHKQKQLKYAYVYILAGCCLIAVVSFNALGSKILQVQLQGKKHGGGRSETIRRMIILLVVSTLTILAQIVFLFVVTYSTVSQRVALVAYVLTEVLPSATLIYTLRPLSRKLAKGKKTGSSSEMSSRTSTTINRNSTSSGTPTSSAVDHNEMDVVIKKEEVASVTISEPN